LGQKEAIKERESNTGKRIEKLLTSAILAQIYILSSHLEPRLCLRNETEVDELIQSNCLEETLDKRAEEVRNDAKQINIEIASKLKFIRQVMYSLDAKKAIQLLTKDQTPQCEVEYEQSKKYFDGIRKTGEPINRNLADTVYKMKETINNEKKKKILDDLIVFIKMKELLRTRGDLSAPGLDGITKPLLKSEREK
jgi:hypothetical protein